MTTNLKVNVDLTLSPVLDLKKISAAPLTLSVASQEEMTELLVLSKGIAIVKRVKHL